MAHESFEDAAVAAVLNRDFISVRVVAKNGRTSSACMTFVQATTGRVAGR
jgi:uncharacterized protein YyaL (SSP411 family)